MREEWVDCVREIFEQRSATVEQAEEMQDVYERRPWEGFVGGMLGVLSQG